MQLDIEKVNSELTNYNQGFLVDKQGLNLRYYQVNAIKATVDAIVAGKKNILLAMATGTGKTRTYFRHDISYFKDKEISPHIIFSWIERV